MARLPRETFVLDSTLRANPAIKLRPSQEGSYVLHAVSVAAGGSGGELRLYVANGAGDVAFSVSIILGSDTARLTFASGYSRTLVGASDTDAVAPLPPELIVTPQMTVYLEEVTTDVVGLSGKIVVTFEKLPPFN